MFLTFKNAAKYGSIALVSAAVTTANAAIDVTSTTAELGEVKVAVLAIGAVVLSIIVGIKLYKWLKQAL
jgi:Zn-dependent alcohol dehydrogenase